MTWNDVSREIWSGMQGLASLDRMPPCLSRLRSPRSLVERYCEVDGQLHGVLCGYLRHWRRCQRWPLRMTPEESWFVFHRLHQLEAFARMQHTCGLPMPAPTVDVFLLLCATHWPELRLNAALSLTSETLLRPKVVSGSWTVPWLNG